MKLAITGLLLMLTVQISVAQKINSPTQAMPQQDYHFYINKRDHYNTAGWVALGGGLALEAVAFISAVAVTVNDNPESKNNTAGPAVALAITGDVAMLGSIPLFIIAHHNKKMAHLSLQKESVLLNNKTTSKLTYTGVGFTIRL